MKKILTFIGAGYVGSLSGLVFALNLPDHEIYIADRNASLIQKWNSDRPPIREQGIAELLAKCRNRNCFFTTSLDASIRGADILFLCVGTPLKKYGQGQGEASDMHRSEDMVRNIASLENRSGPKIVVEMSTVPLGTAESIRQIFKAADMHDSEVLSNPHFVESGTGIRSLLQPDRVVIGGRSTSAGQNATQRLVELYQRWISPTQILCINTWSAELSKLVSNAMLAQRLSSVNTISALCERTGADMSEVVRAIGMDHRIGASYLQPSAGFGGTSFTNDCALLVYLFEYYNLPIPAAYWRQVSMVNNWQLDRFVIGMIDAMFSTLSGKKIAIFGFAFKKNTADCRHSPAIRVVKKLLEERAVIAIWDPWVLKEDIETELQPYEEGMIQVERNSYQAAMGAHAIVILTDWDEFRNYNYELMWTSCARPAFLFDGQNILDHRKLRSYGFDVHNIGLH